MLGPDERGYRKLTAYMVLPEEEGNRLQALLPPEKWLPLRAVAANARYAILVGRFAVPLHTFVRFEPQPGKQQQLREELQLGLASELVTHPVKGIRTKQIG